MVLVFAILRWYCWYDAISTPHCIWSRKKQTALQEICQLIGAADSDIRENNKTEKSNLCEEGD